MSVSKKKFVLTHVVKNAPSMEECKQYFSEAEEHFNVAWYFAYYRRNEFLDLYLHCNKSFEDDTWSIRLKKKLMLISVNGENLIRESENIYGNANGNENHSWGYEEFIEWRHLEKDYLKNGTFTIESHIEIFEMVGIDRKKLRNFDETMKKWADIVLIVEDEKFYVSKLFLASHSTYFNSLLLGNFAESKKSEVILKDINSIDFQNFLEVLHGESAIDDDTVEGILDLTDMYDAPTANRRCEEFLIEESEKMLREKLEISVKYNLKRLKQKSLAEIKSITDIQSMLPKNLEEMDKTVIAAILQKSISLHQ